MATYAYRCARCAEIELAFPIGAAPATAPCPDCGATAVRRFSPPALARTPAALCARLERAARSASEPDVVTSLPPRAAGRAAATHPAISRLPRP
ncbi:MAG TPA: zinc ribbon domain-containing protein [Nonomuraea sp.]|nr:zinc ribbon domain-containing protein [Nonomuraea sp.]